MIHALHARQVDRYFAGTLRPLAAGEMFARLWRCSACRARYERHLLHERALPEGDTRQQERLWGSIVASAAPSAPEVQRRPVLPWRSSRPWSLLGAGAVAGVLLLVAVGVHPRSVPVPVARGTIAEAAGAPTVHYFRTVGDHQTEPVAGTIRPDDGILIGYSNPGAELSYLMVFAVDVQGAVHWYYPAYEHPGDNPAAPSIRTRAVGVELGEEIRHALPAGPLRMVTLFLRRPLRVEEVEGMVWEAWRSHGESVSALETLPLPSEAGQQLSRLLEVRP
ncbi:MAG TPA: hypothetical protein VKZ18_10270 [Polyangia bacterium]|nr:hypothetical protein [Polyangia bacterium]